MIVLVLIILGLILGSFVNALVWRLHEQQRHRTADRKLSILMGRSMCPNCHHELMAKDLVPVMSWLWLKGRCRYCKKPIDVQYPLVELTVPIVFVVSYICWPLMLQGEGLFVFILWIFFIVGFVALAVYDIRWFMLPNRLVYPLIGLAVVQVAVTAAIYRGGFPTVLNALWGVIIISGLFYVIFQSSKGKWIGGGDVKLGLVLGLLAGGPFQSFLLLFVASFLGSLIAVVLLVSGKAKKSTRLPFGPFLLFGTLFAVLFGSNLYQFLIIQRV